MDLLPILSTLRRHKTAALLIVLEIALTSAIVCNALHLIGTRLQRLTHATGLAESELVTVGARTTVRTENTKDTTLRDLQALSALPGVKSVALVNQIAFGGSSSSSNVSLVPNQKTGRQSAANYAVSEGALDTMGLKLVAGRDFKPEEYQWGIDVSESEDAKVSQVIINRALAERLFPSKSALGQSIFVYSETPSTIIGVVDTLPHPHVGREPGRADQSMMFPLRPTFLNGRYLLRVAASDRDRVIKAAEAALTSVDGSRVIVGGKTLSEMRDEYYAQDRAMVWLMVGVIVALLVVTAFGIIGLASFWVQQRTRMIGTRRALGATRGQILRYFQLENFLLTSVGTVLGMLAAYGISLLLMRSYELPRLPFLYLPLGTIVLWALGQIAVWGPARRAATLPPVGALRS